jgi:hypothetical protein
MSTFEKEDTAYRAVVQYVKDHYADVDDASSDDMIDLIDEGVLLKDCDETVRDNVISRLLIDGVDIDVLTTAR